MNRPWTWEATPEELSDLAPRGPWTRPPPSGLLPTARSPRLHFRTAYQRNTPETTP